MTQIKFLHIYKHIFWSLTADQSMERQTETLNIMAYNSYNVYTKKTNIFRNIKQYLNETNFKRNNR